MREITKVLEITKQEVLLLLWCSERKAPIRALWAQNGSQHRRVLQEGAGTPSLQLSWFHRNTAQGSWVFMGSSVYKWLAEVAAFPSTRLVPSRPGHRLAQLLPSQLNTALAEHQHAATSPRLAQHPVPLLAHPWSLLRDLKVAHGGCLSKRGEVQPFQEMGLTISVTRWTS